MRGKKHPDELRAKVVAGLLAGLSVMEVAAEYDVPHPTVSHYKSEIPEGLFDELRRKKGERLDDLVYGYLLRSLTALHKQAEVASDSEYLQKQPASELATLHGVMADKTVRLLEACSRAGITPRQLEPAVQ